MRGFTLVGRIVLLTVVGFVIPPSITFTLEYLSGEFSSGLAWDGFASRYLVAAVGCAILFLLSAITSSTARRSIGFSRSLILLGGTFLVSLSAPVLLVQRTSKTDKSTLNVWESKYEHSLALVVIPVALMFLWLLFRRENSIRKSQ